MSKSFITYNYIQYLGKWQDLLIITKSSQKTSPSLHTLQTSHVCWSSLSSILLCIGVNQLHLLKALSCLQQLISLCYTNYANILVWPYCSDDLHVLHPSLARFKDRNLCLIDDYRVDRMLEYETQTRCNSLT